MELITVENPLRVRIRAIRRLMKNFVQYKDQQWFILRDILNTTYDQLPEKERAR